MGILAQFHSNDRRRQVSVVFASERTATDFQREYQNFGGKQRFKMKLVGTHQGTPEPANIMTYLDVYTRLNLAHKTKKYLTKSRKR